MNPNNNSNNIYNDMNDPGPIPGSFKARNNSFLAAAAAGSSSSQNNLTAEELSPEFLKKMQQQQHSSQQSSLYGSSSYASSSSTTNAIQRPTGQSSSSNNSRPHGSLHQPQPPSSASPTTPDSPQQHSSSYSEKYKERMRTASAGHIQHRLFIPGGGSPAAQLLVDHTAATNRLEEYSNAASSSNMSSMGSVHIASSDSGGSAAPQHTSSIVFRHPNGQNSSIRPSSMPHIRPISRFSGSNKPEDIPEVQTVSKKERRKIFLIINVKHPPPTTQPLDTPSQFLFQMDSTAAAVAAATDVRNITKTAAATIASSNSPNMDRRATLAETTIGGYSGGGGGRKSVTIASYSKQHQQQDRLFQRSQSVDRSALIATGNNSIQIPLFPLANADSLEGTSSSRSHPDSKTSSKKNSLVAHNQQLQYSTVHHYQSGSKLPANVQSSSKAGNSAAGVECLDDFSGSLDILSADGVGNAQSIKGVAASPSTSSMNGEMNPYSLVFKNMTMEDDYAEFFAITSLANLRRGVVIGLLLGLTLFFYEAFSGSISSSSPTQGTAVTNDVLLLCFGAVLPLIILLVISTAVSRSSKSTAKYLHHFSAISTLIIGSISIVLRHYIVEPYTSSFKTSMFLILLLSGSHVMLNIRFIFLTITLPLLLVCFILEASFAANSSPNSQLNTQNIQSVAVSSICLVAAVIFIGISSYWREFMKRKEFVKIQSLRSTSKKLSDQLSRLGRNYSQQVMHFDSPLEKSILLVKTVLSDPFLHQDHVLELSNLLNMLKSGDFTTPDIEKQVEGGWVGLDEEQEVG